MKTFTLFFVLLGFVSADALGDSIRNRIRIQKKSELNFSKSGEDSESMTAEKMDALNKRRRSLIQDIKRFLREARSEDQKGELNLRLGALYMEDYHAGLALAEQQFQKDLAEYNKTKPKGKKPPKIDNSEAISSLDKARTIYKELAARHPNHPRRDEMLYFLALSSIDKGQIDAGMNYFRKLVEDRPKSKYIYEALVALGDHYFEKNKFDTAQTYYDKIVERKHKPLIPYAVYKKGWCAYNLQRTDIALKYFKWVIENEEKDPNVPIRLKGEALRDITLPFVDLKMVDESIAFFKGQGDKDERRGLETMAGLYFEQGDHKNAITVNETLLKLNTAHPKNPGYDISVVESLRLKGDRGAAVQRMFTRLPLYLQDSNWYEINSNDPSVVKEASTRFEEIARKYAFEFHAEGQKTKNENLYKAAQALYEKYLEYFPRTAHASQIRFYLAEIQYRNEQFVAAADNYFTVYKDALAGNLRPDAIRHSLNALDHELTNERKKQGLAAITTKSTAKIKEAEDAVLEETPYSPVEAKFINVSNEYLTAYPKDKLAPDVLYQQAYLHYTHYDFNKAYKSFWQLVQAYPGHSTSYSSAYLILDILNRKKDYPKLVLACQKFLSTADLKKPEFKAEVANILRHSELKRIQLVEAKGEHKQAAQEYLEYTKAYGPQDQTLYEKALYNASVNFMKAEMLIEALESQEHFLRKFQKSNLRENMVLQVAKTYENLANFEKAAQYFDLFATSYTSNPQAKSALRLAGLYYWGANNPIKAEATMKRFLASYPADAKIVQRDLLDVYEHQGNTDKQVQYYLQARAVKGIPISTYVAHTLAIAELGARSKGRMNPQLMEEALRAVERFRKDLAATPHGIEAMSKVYFWYANQKESVLERIRLALPQRQLEVNLQRKLALIKELEKEYARIASLGGGEWGLGAIYKTASAYHMMAQQISEAPVPAELTAEQLDMYRAEVQKEMIKPFKEKALGFVGQCLDKAQEFNLMSTWTAKCYGLGSVLDPLRYPLARSFYVPPVQLAVMMPPTEAKLPLGNYKNYVFPYDSSPMFQEGSRGVASIPSLPVLYNGREEEAGKVVPMALNYRTLVGLRKDILGRALNGEKPADLKKMTFAYLNLLRLNSPERAISSILEAIIREPNNHALHNLLGLAYFDAGNLPAAKVTWLSLIARDIKHPAVQNNLGVIASLEGNEAQAIDWFMESSKVESAKEAFTNLGFIALRYRNGFEAKKQFTKAAQGPEDVTVQVGLSVAKLQNREFDAAKDALNDAASKYKSDPYARLSLAYFVLDVEKDNAAAQQILNDYAVVSPAIESDSVFREAFNEAKRTVAATTQDDGGELPGIGN